MILYFKDHRNGRMYVWVIKNGRGIVDIQYFDIHLASDKNCIREDEQFKHVVQNYKLQK